MSLPAWLLAVPRERDLLLYDTRTGRAAPLSAEGLARAEEAGPVRSRLQRLGMLDPVDPERACAHRSRWVLTLPEERALVLPVPSHTTPGGPAFRLRSLDDAEWRLWQQLDGRPLSRIDGDGLQALLRELCAYDTQAVKLWPGRAPVHALRQLWTRPRPASARSDDQHDAAGSTTLLEYHLGITDGDTHFDDRETTVAHALALPHPTLQGEPFGVRLRRQLAGRGFEVGGVTVEVGCGDGEFAEAWGAGSRYLRVDLSPELLRTQRARVPDSPGVLGDATRLPLRSQSVATLISNEVLADLKAVPWQPGDHHPALTDRLARYGIHPEAGKAWYNLGAWQMLEEVARVLAPGGRAYLSEFGSVDGQAEEAVQLDHPEVSIDFGTLARVAAHLGLQAELVHLPALLDADLTAPQLSRHSWMGLRALARSRAVHLEARSWTPQTLRLPWRVDGLDWTTASDEGPGPLITRFYALLVEAGSPR